MQFLDASVLVALLLVLTFLGVHVAVCLGTASMWGLWRATGGDMTILMSFLNSTAYEALRDYVFAVIPLFLLMGEFIARCGLATDIYRAINRNLSRIPGRLAHATVVGNVVFAFVTGTSVASATAFTAIAFPEMRRYRYNTPFSLGLISGSACLGMLIPPSLLMVVWGLLTEQSIGEMFLAGVLPGFLLASLMLLYIVGVSVYRPEWVGEGPRARSLGAQATAEAGGGGSATPGALDTPDGNPWISGLGFLAILAGSLGGIWAGFFTPTEGAGIGALIALVVAWLKGMRWRGVYECVLAVGRTAAPLMVIVFAAQLYSRTLALSGIGATIEALLVESGLGTWGVVLIMVVIWMALGMVIDSVSIMLLTVPIFFPIAVSLALDPMAFAIVGILVVEAGLLTPPFGILVFAVKAAAERTAKVSLGDIFRGATPLWLMLLLVVVLLFAEPRIATLLPNLILR
jgi:TRAP-type C4-dicarboxylate transport system permease large subunit